MKHFKILIVVIFLPISFQSCSLSIDCQNAIGNLIITLTSNVTNVFREEPVNFDCIVENIQETIEACSNNDSTMPATNGEMIIAFSNTGDLGSFNEIERNTFDIPALKIGEKEKNTLELSFPETGFYKVTVKCNSNNLNESNYDDNEDYLLLKIE